ncbi:MAG: hypothetical protein IPL96_12360 [Holophagaceae bacterium]|nr:hypothetical protein [Holophagaceae bacterium]
MPTRPFLPAALASLALCAGSSAPQEPGNPGARRVLLPARRIQVAGPAAGPASGHDRADLRRDAARAWFGGAATPAYLDFKGRLAAEHRTRFAASFADALADPASGAKLPAAGFPSGTSAWTNLGPRAEATTPGFPDMDSGRPVGILTHPTDPKIVYLATSGGGVFKSVDADLATAADWTWTPLTDGLPASGSSGNLSVGALAMSPADPNVLYLGLGDAFDAEGRGLYRSTDGGATWTAAAGLCAGTTRVYDILALDANLVLAGTNGGLLRSTDGGATFTCTAPFGAGAAVWCLRRIGATGVLATAESGSGQGSIWTSTDALNPGSAWAPATVTAPGAIGRITVATTPASASVAWGIYEDTSTGNIAKGLLKSTNAGASWSFVASPGGSTGLFNTLVSGLGSDGGQGFYNHLLAVDPGDANRLFVGANLALYRTLDGGASYEQLTHWYGANRVYAHADFHRAAWSKTGPATLYVGNDGGLCILRDPYRAPVPGGSSPASDPTFIDNRRNKGLATHLVYNLGSTQAANAPDAGSRISLGLQDNGTRIRQGSGAALATSAVFEDAIGGDGFGTLWHPADAARVLASLYYANLQISADGGATFNAATTGLTGAGDANAAPFFTKLAPGPGPQPDAALTFTNSTVFRTANFGGSWSPISNAASLPLSGRVIRNVAGSALDPKSVAIVTSGGTGFATADGGATWSPFGTLPGNALFMSSVWFDPLNERTLYAASVAPDPAATHLWRSLDAGATWASVEGPGFPSGIPVHVIQSDPGNGKALFAGTDFGVYASQDGGASWARYGTGLPLVAVRDLYVAPDGSFLRAATFGRGVWELRGAADPVAPSINRDPMPVSVYAGAGATFTATANGSPAPALQWRKGGVDIPGATAPAYTTPPATAGDDGAAFSLRATNASGSATSGAALLTVLSTTAPAITLDPVGQTLPEGAQATFTGAATGVPPPTLQWRRGGVDIPGATGATYTLAAVQDADHLVPFTLVATNVAGSATSAPALLTVNLEAPSIVAPPQDQAVLEGATATFMVLNTGSSTDYQWQRDGVDLPNASATSYLTGPTTLADNGAAFTVRVFNRGGSVTSAPGILTVNPLPAAPVITGQPADANAVVGQTATFSVAATGIPAPGYAWRRNGVPIPGAGGADYTTPPTALVDDGATFTVLVANSEGSRLSDPAVLRVSLAPQPPAISFFKATPAAVQPGGAATLSWSVAGATDLALAGLGPVQGTSLVVAPAASTTYILSASNAAGTVTAIATVAVRSRDLDGAGDTGDVLDLAVLARAYGGPGVATAVAAADLDGDGDCDEDDLAIFLAGF